MAPTQPHERATDNTGMKRKVIRIVLPEVDRVRWQYGADVTGVELERFVREAVEALLRTLQPSTIGR